MAEQKEVSGLYLSMQSSLDLIKSTAAALPSSFKESFLKQVGSLIDGLLPEDVVITNCSSHVLDGQSSVAVEAANHCIGTIEFTGLRELCASALRAAGIDGA